MTNRDLERFLRQWPCRRSSSGCVSVALRAEGRPMPLALYSRVGEDRPDPAAIVTTTFGDAEREGVELVDNIVSTEARLRQDAFDAQRPCPLSQHFKDGDHDGTVPHRRRTGEATRGGAAFLEA